MFGVVSLPYPFARDQGEYAVFADAVLRGAVPYRDVVNVKPPLTAVVHAVALVLFGHSMSSIRVLDLLWTMATTLGLYAFCKRALGRSWLGAMAAIVYSFSYYQLAFHLLAQTDGWLNLPTILAMLALVVAADVAHRQDSKRLTVACLAAGGHIALAILFKYTVGLILVACGVFLVLEVRRETLVRSLVSFALGFLGVLALFVVILATIGALPAFMESQFLIVPGYAQVGRPGGVWRGLFLIGLYILVGFGGWVSGPLASIRLAALLPSVCRRLAHRGRRDEQGSVDVLILLWLLAAIASVYAQGKYFPYHFLPLFPALSIMAAQSVSRYIGPLWARWARGPARVGIVALTVACFVVPSAYPSLYASTWRVLSGQQDLRRYWDTHEFEYFETPEAAIAGFSLPGQLALVDYVREKTEPRDTLFIWGSEPVVYFLSGRPMVSRFIHIYQLASLWAPRSWRDELMDELRQSPPEVFIVVHDDVNPGVLGHEQDSYTTYRQFAELREFVERGYVFEARVERFEVYRRRTA